MIRNTLAITARIYRQLLGDGRFLALALTVPLILVYLFKVFIVLLPLALFTKPEPFYILATAFLVHFTSYVLCLIVIVRERREGTLSRMFVNNFRRAEIVGGYLLGYAGLATLQALLVLAAVDFSFSLSFGPGRMISIFTVLWGLSLISIGLGILVSNLARTEAQIFPFIPLFIVPSIFLSGLLLPVSSLPWPVRWLSSLIPLTYALEVLRPLFDESPAQGARLGGWLGFTVYGLVLLGVATLTLRERD